MTDPVMRVLEWVIVAAILLWSAFLFLVVILPPIQRCGWDGECYALPRVTVVNPVCPANVTEATP